jgi:epoxyqueuosine reductase
MLTSQMVKDYALSCGADLVGIASMDRWEGAPLQADPRQIAPDAKSMIVMGFRIPRGTLRGIEEGTFYVSYCSMGYAAINHVLQPMVCWQVTAMLEDSGYEAVPIPNNFPWTNMDSSGQHPEHTDDARLGFSHPVGPGKPAPDVFVHMRIAAVLAGLGEIGYSKMFLSPKFGPRQRIAAILTDAPLEPDPLYDGKLCDRCMLCARDCTGGAISTEKTVKITAAGKDIEWGEIDYKLCSRYFCGASEEYNPFMTTEADKEGFRQEVGKAQQYKCHSTYDYGRALEGARGCIRACMVHLEEQGKLSNSFDQPFRRRPQWKLG